MSTLPERFEEEIRRIVDEHDLLLVAINRRGQTNSTVLEIIVDSEKGADLDSVARVNRQVSDFLDEEEDLIPGRYRLEVSTPGLDRPLEFDWQYRKNTGRLLKVRYTDDDGGEKNGLFRLNGVTDTELQLETTSKGKGKARLRPGQGEPFSLNRSRLISVIVEPEF